MTTEDDIKRCLAQLGRDAKPYAGWEQRVLAACRAAKHGNDAEQIDRAERILATTLLLAKGDGVATHEALVHAVILNAVTHAKTNADVDEFLASAAQALTAARTEEP